MSTLMARALCGLPQIEPHDCIAELFAPLGRFNTILIDFDRCTPPSLLRTGMNLHLKIQYSALSWPTSDEM